MWLELELSTKGRMLQVAGRGCRGERPAAHVIADETALDAVQQFSTKVGRAVSTAASLDATALSQAQAVYQAVLHGELRDVLARLVEASKDQGPVLVRLFVQDASLQSVPWEALCKPGTTDGFWGTDPRVVVARGVMSPEAWDPGVIEDTVRVLVIAPGESESTVLSLRNALDFAIASGAIEWLDPIVGPNIDARRLYDRLRNGPAPHIVHFIGHGSVDEQGNPNLRLADEDGESVWVRAESLARELGAHFASTLRLVVLEACEGAKPGAFGSAAEAFAEAGASAVVAHLWPVKAETARIGSSVLYRALTMDRQTRGDIGSAVAAMRRTLLATSAEAFSPILCLRGESSVIFQFSARPSAVADDAEFSDDTLDLSPPPFFIGREHELTHLHGLLENALADKPSLAFVAGEPGIGKTALIDTFCRNTMHEMPSVVFVAGHCVPRTGHEDPYGPIVDMLLHLVGAVRTMSMPAERHALLEVQRSALHALFAVGRELIGPLLPPSVLRPHLATLAAQGHAWAKEAETRLATMNETMQPLPTNRVHWQVSELLTRVAETHPLVVVLEDLHWVDDASAGLLLHLAARMQGSKLLVIGTYRSNMVVDESGHPHPMTLVLRESTRTSGNAVVNLDTVSLDERKQWSNTLLAAQPQRTDDQFRELFFEHTGGHPLFALELLHALQARAEASKDGDNLSAQAIAWGDLPSRVEGVIGERLAGLDPAERELLGMASVEGTNFTLQILATLRKEDERSLLRTISQNLEKKHRIVASAGTHWLSQRKTFRYRFTQGLIQQYVYNDLSPAERMLLHRDIAECLEKVYAGQTELLAVVLAHHYTQADEPDKAIEYWLQAGQRAVRVSAYREGIVQFERALELLERMPQNDDTKRRELRIRIPLCTALQATETRLGGKSRSAYERARALCLELEDRVSLAAIQFGICYYRLIAADFEAAEELALDCLEIGTSLGVTQIQVFAYAILTVVSFWTAKFTDVDRYIAELKRLYDPSQSQWYQQTIGHDPMQIAQWIAVWMRMARGDVDGALEGASELVEADEQNSNAFMRVQGLQMAACVGVMAERSDVCQAYAQRLVDVATKYDLPVYVGLGKLLAGYQAVEPRKVDEYAAAIEKIYQTFLEGSMDLIWHALCSFLRWDAYDRAGEYAKALSSLDRALSFLDRSRTLAMTLELSRRKGETLLRMGRTEEAKQTLQEVLTLSQQLGATLVAQKIGVTLASIDSTRAKA